MSLNICRRFIGEQRQIDAILDCAYKNFMYSQGKQIIYITTRGKDQRQFNGCDCLMYSKYCDGIDTHRKVRAAYTQEQRNIAQKTRVPEYTSVKTRTIREPAGNILIPPLLLLTRICHLFIIFLNEFGPQKCCQSTKI